MAGTGQGRPSVAASHKDASTECTESQSGAAWTGLLPLTENDLIRLIEPVIQNEYFQKSVESL